MAKTWTATDPRWLALTPYQRAAAMSLMEADGTNPDAARNALGAMVNRAAKSGEDIGAHVSRAIYQPAIEPAQQARLSKILQNDNFPVLTSWAERRARGEEPDPVKGATHFLAPEKTMLALEAREPNKYRSWRSWTGFNPETGQYNGTLLRDASHAFLAPEGEHSVPSRGSMNGGFGLSPTGTAGVSGAVHTATPNAPSPLFRDTAPEPVPQAPTMMAGSGNGVGAFAPSKSPMAMIGEGLGTAAGAFAKGGQDDQRALDAVQRATAQALSDEEQRHAAALQRVMARRQRGMA